MSFGQIPRKAGVAIGLCTAQLVIQVADYEFPVSLQEEEVQQRHGVPAAGDTYQLRRIQGKLRLFCLKIPQGGAGFAFQPGEGRRRVGTRRRGN
ncbi:hypothetical protein [Verrucomicrobium sp. BvORR106]|uniref:hypothetical protein n=1 Tax=Verrucomicrobium sp. BvORR106 TaxID=1403819 RepID=UPI000690DD8C|nr:hypothetical protein [Verrucomicrobium sp. BvORR106]